MAERRKISELEGAILSEIEHRGRRTAFQVRRAFADSFSLEWKGSAGAVYTAVRRLERDGFLHASAAQGGRATRHLSLTPAGREALAAWARDPLLASSVGVDPFRLRAGIWPLLPASSRHALFRDIEQAVTASIRALETYLDEADRVEHVRIELALAVQRARLTLLSGWLGSGSDADVEP